MSFKLPVSLEIIYTIYNIAMNQREIKEISLQFSEYFIFLNQAGRTVSRQLIHFKSIDLNCYNLRTILI